MAISVRGQVANVGASVTPTIVLPAGILGGECIRVTIGWNSAGAGVTCTTPTGFTLIDTLTYGAASVSTFYKVAAGTVGSPSSDAGATVAATMSVSKAWTIGARVYSGSNTTTPIHAHSIASATPVVTTHAAPTVSVTRTACWLEEGVVERGSSTGYTPPGAVSTNLVSAGPQAVTGSVLMASATSAGAVGTGTQGGDIWTGTVANNSVITWTNAIAAASAATNPTASISGGATGGLTVNVDGTGSVAVSPATLSSWDWDWGDSTTHGTGSTARHKYAAAGTYTIVLTVTDSVSATDTETLTVTVSPPAATVLPLLVSGTGFTPTGGTELGVFVDTLESTFDTSPGTPTGVAKTYFFAEIAAPTAGQGIYFETLTDRLNSTSGSFTAKLYQDTAKTILISTVSGVSVPDGSASASHPDSANTPPVVVNFPAADVAAMTDFSTPTVELTETAA